MKLAEALLLRAEYQKKLANLYSRIMANLKVQENESPNENPDELLKESFAVNDQLNALIKQINARNNEVKLPSGQSISDALADRESLMKKRNLLAEIAANASMKDFRLTHAEIKMHVTLPIAEIQKQVDDLSRRFRELDAQIQALNWTVDLEG